VTGESGVGKDVVAWHIHAQSPRRRNRYVPVNCAGIPETLLESELFGHVRGSFTGAFRDKPGKLEMADGGTAFLDEVGEMSLRMQGLLLRFLETGELQKVGADDYERQVNVRVIAATNRDLRGMVTASTFREDLFYRLNVIHLNVPPLRDHRDDVPLLVDYFVHHLAPADREPVTFTPEALKALTEYSWPGNVRELENVIERVLVTIEGPVIDVHHLPSEVRSADPLAMRPVRERRRTIADELFKRMVRDGESFWTVVHPRFMERDITRADVREIVRRGLEQSHGHYRILIRQFNMQPGEYKRFLNFLRKHECHVPFKEYR
jgi:transcriptional regulator with GAF, ATPase, and Fis domain